MKKNHIIYILTLVLTLAALSSCSENNDEVEEFANWQSTNEAYFDRVYTEAKAKADGGDAAWKTITSYQFEPTAPAHNYNNIVVNVIESGHGSGCPLYTDSVRANLRGRILPSASYPSGYIFLSTYDGDYDAATAATGKYAVSTNTYVPDGLSTALQNMHIGDRWIIYVPYQLGYGTSDQKSGVVVPAYSTLVYDVRLTAYYRAGVQVPDAKAAGAGVWIEE